MPSLDTAFLNFSVSLRIISGVQESNQSSPNSAVELGLVAFYYSHFQIVELSQNGLYICLR